MRTYGLAFCIEDSIDVITVDAESEDEALVSAAEFLDASHGAGAWSFYSAEQS